MHQIGDAKREETTASGADGAAGGDADEGRKVAEAEEEAALKLGLELGLTPAQIAFEQNKKRRVRSPPPRHRVALHTAQCTALDCRAPRMCVCACAVYAWLTHVRCRVLAVQVDGQEAGWVLVPGED